MIFRRSAAGINNLHLFFRVDCVVYCEGGDSIELAAIYRGDGDETTLDIMFWSGIRTFLKGTKKCHFKSVGGKAILDSLEQDIISGSVKTILICRDSDFDEILGSKHNHPFLLYTFGYSWENDVVRSETVISVFKSYLPNDDQTEKLATSLKESLARLNKIMESACERDLALICSGRAGLFVRSQPLGLFENYESKPDIVARRVKARLGMLGLRRFPPRRHSLPNKDALRHTCGHVVASLVYKLLVGHVMRRDSRMRISMDLFLRNCIHTTMVAMGAGQLQDLTSHFAQFAKAFESEAS